MNLDIVKEESKKWLYNTVIRYFALISALCIAIGGSALKAWGLLSDSAEIWTFFAL